MVHRLFHLNRRTRTRFRHQIVILRILRSSHIKLPLQAAGMAYRCRTALDSERVQQLSVLTFELLLATLIIGRVISIILQRRVKIFIGRIDTIVKILLDNFCAPLLAEAEVAEHVDVLAAVLFLDFGIHDISDVAVVTF